MAQDEVSKASGTPCPSHAAGPVTPWSLAAYELLNDWDAVRSGAWLRWEPGYLVLTITTADGEPIEKVMVDTANEELSIEFGFWPDHSEESERARAVPDMIEKAERWLSGHLSTVAYLKANGDWCGTRCHEGPGILHDIGDTELIRSFAPMHVELRRTRRAEWRRFAIAEGRVTEVTGKRDD